jgi:hypothetical protein
MEPNNYIKVLVKIIDTNGKGDFICRIMGRYSRNY